MKKALFGLVIILYSVVLINRLQDWYSNKTIWVASARTEPNDPWSLNNAANYTHDARTLPWLIQLTNLEIPYWLPMPEMEPYYIGYKSLSETYRDNGFLETADAVERRLLERIFRYQPNFTYIATPANNAK